MRLDTKHWYMFETSMKHSGMYMQSKSLSVHIAEVVQLQSLEP